MQTMHRAETRNVVLLALAVVIFAAAVYFYFRLSARDAAPTDHFVGFYCPTCKHFFRISDREFEKQWDRKEYKLTRGEKSVLFKCQKCGQLTAERADGPPADSQPKPPGG